MTRKKKPIEWTDATWNPVRGCKPVSPGCANCYAELMTGRLEAMGSAGYAGLTKPGTGNKRFLFSGEFRTAPDRLEDPMRWKKPRMVFVNSMSDLFGEGVSFEFIAAVFGVMAACPQHTFQILTKRAERMFEFFDWVAKGAPSALEGYLRSADYNAGRCARRALNPPMDEPPPPTAELRRIYDAGRPIFSEPLARCPPECHWREWPLQNVWLGVSAENQECADKRIPALLKTPAAVRFLSLEPLLGPIKLADFEHVDWVIVGGESGPNARPCQLEWVADIVAQCKAAVVPCFVKQLGSNAWDGGKRIKLIGKGGDPAEWPAACREWPREWPRKVM